MLRARRRALDAQVVITNHALLFSDVAASGALLGPHDVLVVDEAHHLEDVATGFFTISYSPRSVRGAHDSVYTPEYGATVRYVRAMVAGDSAEAAGAIDELWGTFLDSVATADEKTAELFALLGKNVAAVSRQTNGVHGGDNEGYEADQVQVVYSEGAPLFYGAEAAAVDVSRALGRMEAAAGEILEIVEGSEALAESGAGGALRAIRDAAVAIHAEFDFLISGSAEDHVFYARLDSLSGTPDGSRGGAVSVLTASPVDVSARLGTVLEEGSNTSVLTSATLAVEGDFSFTLERLGLDGSRRADTKRYDSPFDLDTRRAILLADYMPNPTEVSFAGEAAAVIEDVVAACRRRALVLCTARGQVATLNRLLSKSPTAGGELFVQTDGSSREDLLARFRKSRRGVLVGLASFWEGIDLPGDELELLVILKLPFLVPTEPVTQARSRRITENGDNAFEKLFLPDVVLKLKQGMGRLIRTGRDRGAVLILDRRLGHSRYGEFVLRAVTNRFVRCEDRGETIERLERYFSEQ
jgi:Rad3-related DNA helicase